MIRPPIDLCAGFEPHPWSIYAEEFCVAPVYVGGRPRYCGRPRNEHGPATPPLHVGPPVVVKPIKDETKEIPESVHSRDK